MAVEPGDLLIFARVVDAGGFGRAAERLSMPKSTVSRRVTALEAALGERLLQRTTRKLVVTEFGAQLLGPARETVAAAEQAVALAESSRGRATGRLRVSMPGDLAGALASAMAKFAVDHPDVQLELDLSPRRVDVIAEGYDLAVRTGALPDDPYLAARHLADLSGGLFASPAYLKRNGAPKKPGDLADHIGLHLVRRDAEPAPWSLTSPDGEVFEGVQTRRSAANSYNVLTLLAVGGAGVAVLPYLFARPHVEAGALVAVLPKWSSAPSPIWAVFPSRKYVPAKTRVFVNVLSAAMSKFG